ncbi:MAG: hypothetical protein GY703_18920, partial [Gammaproteobacteria bacterium]|nr:hypothetical protein [Gammaproteobacteria bacterium]
MALHERYKGELRSAAVMRELDKAKHDMGYKGIGLVMRITLVILFMYLVLMASELFGTTGTILVSILFLTVYFIPVIAQKIMTKMRV